LSVPKGERQKIKKEKRKKKEGNAQRVGPFTSPLSLTKRGGKKGGDSIRFGQQGKRKGNPHQLPALSNTMSKEKKKGKKKSRPEPVPLPN